MNKILFNVFFLAILFCGRAFGTDCDSMLSRSLPACVETQNAYLSYIGNAVSVDSLPGHIVGNIHLKVGLACLFEDKWVNSNYQQIGLTTDLSYSKDDIFYSDVPGLEFKALHNIAGLAGVGNRIVLLIIGRDKPIPDGFHAVKQASGNKKYVCISGYFDKDIMSLVRNEEPITPGEKEVNLKAPTYLIRARYTTSPSDSEVLTIVPPAKVTVGAATCEINNHLIAVNMNNGHPMLESQFDKINQGVNISLSCSSVGMNIPYKILPEVHINDAMGIFGIEKKVDSAEGVAYQIKSFSTGAPLDLSDTWKIFKKDAGENHAELNFTISPVKIAPSVKSGSADANLTLSINYP
ncbi:TPA: fimbrial protein [Escherichia coli]|uniref:fimbrial protein n=1 Tax=Escherichia coli TaxID=562 RepID=UPI0018060893|nr:hypothetical protein [Escherichia coli]MCX3719386.1 type 1 fimbrial protein [Escherichia coli]HAJ0462634.1 hypothetical protein [Escherichia coli]HAX3430008.1 type 1 fimbrial protein [Escherichia coli]